MKTTSELKCPDCGKTKITGEMTTLDRRTGMKPAGLGTLLFGIILLAIAVFVGILVIINWGDPIVPGQKYMVLPIALLAGAVSAISSYLRAERVNIIVFKCGSCGMTFTEEEVDRTDLTKLAGIIEHKKEGNADHLKKIFWICSIIVASLAVVFLLRRPKTVMEPSSSGSRILVVMPFENLGLPEHEDLAISITETINTHLSGMDGLDVIPHENALQYKDSDKTSRQISNELGVDFLIDGSVLGVKSDNTVNRIRIVVQLVRSANNTILWSESYERDLVELSRVQSDIVRKVATQLGDVVLESEH